MTSGDICLFYFGLLFAVLFAPSTFAFDGHSLILATLCSKQTESCSNADQEWKEKLQWTCELEIKSHSCVELAKEHPDWAPLMRKCDLKSQCQELKEYNEGSAAACLRGYKNAMIDLGVSLKDMSLSLAGLVEESWERAKTNVKRRAEFLRECNKSLECKRDLVKDDHRYNQMSDEKLNSYTAVFLETQARDLKAYKASLDRARVAPYVPISERPRDETILSTEQKEKLTGLMRMARSKLREQYNRYSCYTELAQEELECYAIGTVVDPTMVAGYFLKGTRVAVASHRLASAKWGAEGLRVTRADLVGDYLKYSPTTVVQNEKWIALAEKGTSAKMTFLDVENSQMKLLNDSLKDKNLVTGMTNYHKELLFTKIAKLEADNPGLVVDEYSDFKSSRFAFSGKVPKDIEQQLSKILTETNAEFRDHLKAAGVESVGTEEWFRAGIGKSADQANLAARYSRQSEKNEIQNFQNTSLQSNLQSRVSDLNSQRRSLRSEVAGTSMLDGSTFHQDVFDLIRKGKGDTEQVTQALKNRFGLSELSTSTVKKMEAYVQATDEFSPGIHIAKREVAHLNNASQGGLSADIIGLGAANLKGTAEALASSDNLERVLEATRSAEKTVTRNFNEQKSYFEKVLAQSVDPGKLKSFCSGDDCVAVATKPLSEAEKTKILQGLADSKYSGSYRLAFIPDGVRDAAARNALANHGEAVEKILRQSLSASMEPNTLKGLTFAVDMRTQNLNEGGLKLLMGEAPGVRLSQQERRLIQKKFSEAIKKFNDEIKQQGSSPSYHPLP